MDISKAFSKVEAIIIHNLKLEQNENSVAQLWNDVDEELSKVYSWEGMYVEKPSLPKRRKIHKMLEFKIEVFFAGLDIINPDLQLRISMI